MDANYTRSINSRLHSLGGWAVSPLFFLIPISNKSRGAHEVTVPIRPMTAVPPRVTIDASHIPGRICLWIGFILSLVCFFVLQGVFHASNISMTACACFRLSFSSTRIFFSASFSFPSFSWGCWKGGSVFV